MAHFGRLMMKSSLLINIRNNKELKDSIRLNTSAAVVGIQNNDNFVRKKFADLMVWYEEVTGMDEVRLAQKRVLDAEENFISAQDRRRESNKEVAAIQAKLKELYGELESTTRGEERYVVLITQEHRVLKEERRLVEEFSRYEREERDYFSSLSTAVKDSHEKERAQAEKTKYWSIIGSIIGTVIGIFGSSINNEIKMKQLRRLVQDSLVKKEADANVPEALERQEKQLSQLLTEIKNVVTLPNTQATARLNELVQNLSNSPRDKSDTSLKTVVDTLSHLDASNNKKFDELTAMIKSQSYKPELKGDQLVVMPVGLEERLNKQYQSTQIIILGSSVAAIALPFVFKYFGIL